MIFTRLLQNVARLALALFLSASALPARAAPENETLLTPLPRGFEIGYRAKDARQAMTEYVPSGESVDGWSRMVTVQIFFNLGNADPDAFAGNLAKGWMAACAGGGARKVTAGVENGYAFSLWIYNCPLNAQTGKPESMWLKATSGADSLYAVQYAYRAGMSTELIRPAMDYLRGVTVCDTRRADRPCPNGM